MATRVKKPLKKKPTKAAPGKTKKAAKVAKKTSKPVKAKKVIVAKKTSPAKGKSKPVSKKSIKTATAKSKKMVTKKAAMSKAPTRISKPSKRPIAKPKTHKPVKAAAPLNFLISGEIAPYKEVPGEQYMNDKQREHFRKILLHRKHQIMLEMDRTVHHLQDEPVNLPDPNDRASQEEEFSLELRARDRERKFIKNIEDALQRLDDGIYGECESCGVEIGIRRLEARPTATLCIDCKTLDEIREKQMGG